MNPHPASPPRPARARAGMTALELLVALGVAATLASVSVVSILPFLRKGRVVEAVNAIDRANNEARTYARLRAFSGTQYYGVRVIADQTPNAVEVIYADGGGEQELQRISFNRNIQVYRGESPLSSNLTYWFQPRTGYPTPVKGGVVSAIGAVPAGDSAHLSCRTLDGKNRYAFAIYEVGIVGLDEF